MNARMITRLNKRWASWPGWARQLSVALVYVAAYLGTRHLSFYHWYLPAGVRLLAVLLAPYRYWMTLLACNSLAGISAIINCEYTFGIMWESLMLVPQNIFIMPLVAWGRSKRWLLYPLRLERSSTVIALIVLMVAAALLIPLWIYVIDHAHQLTPGGPSREEWLQRNILGSYLGMLTLVPVGLFIVDLLTNRPSAQLSAGDLKSWWLGRRAAMLEISANLCLVVGLYLFMRSSHSAMLSFGFRACLLLPIGWTALRLGWGGAAIIGAAASIALASLSSESYDPLTMEMEFIIGLCLTLFLLLGARIDQLDRSERREKADNRRHLEAGRQLQGHAELRFQRVGGWMSEIADPALTPPPGIRAYLDRLLPPTESLRLQNQGLLGKLQMRRLGRDLAPLPLKLDGAEAEPFQALKSLFEKEHIRFRGRLRGSLADVSPLAYQAICRLLADACAYLVSQPQMYIQLDLGMRRIDRHGESAIAIRVRASRQSMIYDPAQREAQLKRLLQISSTGLELQGMAHLAKLYRGRLRHRTLDSGQAQCIQLLLKKDPEQGHAVDADRWRGSSRHRAGLSRSQGADRSRA